MNARIFTPKKITPLLVCALAGWGGLRAQFAVPDWPPSPPAGPYAPGYNPHAGRPAPDVPIPGFVGPAGDGVAPYGGQNLTQYVNPEFVEWASSVADYSPARPDTIESYYLDPTTSLGAVTGNVFDVVSLGDLSSSDIAEGVAPGSLTLGFDTPVADGPGPDFVVFGNAFFVRGKAVRVFSKLAYVEVSSDGVNFARFPAVDLNPRPAQSSWPYLVSDPTLIYNLFGKAVNGYGASWGEPFDLAELSQHPLATAGLLDLQNVRFVRLVAVVGNGEYSVDAYGDPIYDPWPTTGSPGPEVQAIGVLNTAPAPGSPNGTASPGLSNTANFGHSNAPVSALGVKKAHGAPTAARVGPTPAFGAMPNNDANELSSPVQDGSTIDSASGDGRSNSSLQSYATAGWGGETLRTVPTGKNSADPAIDPNLAASQPASVTQINAKDNALISPASATISKEAAAPVAQSAPSSAMPGFVAGPGWPTALAGLAALGALAWWYFRFKTRS